MSQKSVPLFALVITLALAACRPADEPAPEPSSAPDQDEALEQTPEPVSILRPDVEAETQMPDMAPDQSFTATIGFPDGGSDLDADALAALEKVKASEQFSQTGAIILGAHSDSGGSDVVNERAAEERGLAVAQWLIAAGAEPRRIDVIVFGEQNPAQPNALADGSPNEAGRALNRRVEIEILASMSASEGVEEVAPSSEPSDEP